MEWNALLSVSLFLGCFFGAESRVCISNPKEPPYQPNIYVCNETFSCCQSYGQDACCSVDLSFSEFGYQVSTFLIFTAVLLGMATVIAVYFNDPSPLDDEGKLKERIAQDQGRGFSSYALKDETDEAAVRDPLFGPVMWDVPPRYAHYERNRHQNPDDIPEVYNTKSGQHNTDDFLGL